MPKQFKLRQKDESRKKFVPPGLAKRREKRRERWSPEYREASDIRSSRRWQKLRDMYRREHPMCQFCNERPANDVHHIVPLIEAPNLGYSKSNLLAVCRQCHTTIHTREKIEDFEEVRKEIRAAKIRSESTY